MCSPTTAFYQHERRPAWLSDERTVTCQDESIVGLRRELLERFTVALVCDVQVGNGVEGHDPLTPARCDVWSEMMAFANLCWLEAVRSNSVQCVASRLYMLVYVH